MFAKEIEEYEALRGSYDEKVARPMGAEESRKYNEILFSAHSCAIEGNSFTVDDTRELKEKGLAMVPRGASLLEAFEMLDHFNAYEYMTSRLDHPLDEALLKEVNRRVMLHTLSYRSPGATPGEYTDVDMAAGDTLFGDHAELVARVPQLLESTRQALSRPDIHPMVVAARFHGFFEYLHPFRDGNGRTGRLLSNYILLRSGHPLLVIMREQRDEYIAAMKAIRKEATDTYLVSFFFKCAIARMRQELSQVSANPSRLGLFLF